jgi:hypothetical protein
MRYLAALAAVFLLASCAATVGVPLSDAQHRVLTVPAIDDTFVPAPMRIGVFITPQAANAPFLSDLRNTPNGNLLTYGPLGPGILSGVAEYFPKAFAEVYLLGEFPHVVVDAADIDAVLVFESGLGSGHTQGTTAMEPINDVLLNIGVYSPAGQRLLGYQVVASTKVQVEWDLNITRAVQRGYDGLPAIVRNAVRLALVKFPAKDVYAAAMASRKQRAGALTSEATLRQRAQEMNQQIAANAPPVNGKPRDAMEWATGMAKTVNALSMAGVVISGGLVAVPGAAGLATVSGGLSNMVLTANTPGSQAGMGSSVVMAFIGGAASAQLQRAQAMAGQPTFPRAPASGPLCLQIGQVAAACTADACRTLFRQTAENLACTP